MMLTRCLSRVEWAGLALLRGRNEAAPTKGPFTERRAVIGCLGQLRTAMRRCWLRHNHGRPWVGSHLCLRIVPPGRPIALERPGEEATLGE